MYIERIFNTRKGRVAYSPSRHCNAVNRIPHTPKQVNRPMEVGLFQGMDWPHHCRARRRETMEPRKMSVPRGSRCFSFSVRGRERFFLFVSGDTWTKMMMAMRIAAPMGTLLCVLAYITHLLYRFDVHPETPSYHKLARFCSYMVFYGTYSTQQNPSTRPQSPAQQSRSPPPIPQQNLDTWALSRAAQYAK
jgi:hypothetical protein